jgi:hypothetical protein
VKKLALTIVIAVVLASSAGAQSADFAFHWSPSPTVDNQGQVRPDAVSYEVYVKRGSAAAALLATVSDTLYTLTAEPGIVHRLMVRALDGQGHPSAMSEASDPIYFETIADDDRGVPGAPPGAQLGSNYPNPFNPETRVVYGVPQTVAESDLVRLDIYNLQGQLVRRLAAERSPGWHEAVWDGKNDQGVVASTGMYLTRFTVGTMVTTGKMTMVK